MNYKDTQAIRQALRAERWSKARSLISTQLQTFRRDPWLLANLAYTYDKEGRSLEAKRLLAQAYRQAPKDPFILWEYASLLADLGRHEQALGLFLRIMQLKINPSSWIETGTSKRRADGFINDCRFRAGISNYFLHQTKPAVHYLEKYIKCRGQCATSIYTIKEARDKIETIRNYDVINNTPITKENSARLRRAIKKELKKAPRDYCLLIRLCYIYYDQARYRQSLELADEALKIKPGDIEATWCRANILEKLDQNKAAIRLYKSILLKGLDKCAADGGKRWARMLLNDCRCAIGMCYWVMLKDRLAVRWLKEHLKRRHHNDTSVYSQKFIRNTVVDLELNQSAGPRSRQKRKERTSGLRRHPNKGN